METKIKENEETSAIAYLAGGCFWCMEALFARLPGILKVTSGYMGGNTPNPTYERVYTDTTGHAETVKIEFNPRQLSYLELLTYFMALHDPTELNRQGADVGTRYRSAIFYTDGEQKKAATELLRVLDEAKIFPRPIVTEIAPAGEFYPAEEEHQDYFAHNPDAPYCQLVIEPKIEKMSAHIAAVEKALKT